MNTESIGEKTVRATKWSFITQVVSKLIQPITTLVLAHLLAPSVFGVIALVTMVTSFADMFSDAGFQKYLIQHEYNSKKGFNLSCNVAFWTNLAISIVLWILIGIARNPIATMLGDSSIGTAIVVACASLPLTSAVSVQTAVYQRKFDFKTLFYSRVGSSFLILFVSVPLAMCGAGYWSMIIGTVVSNLFLAIWLTICSEWKPSLCFSFAELKSMFSFSAWTLAEAFSIWVTNWAGAFILGTLMSAHYLGLYNTTVSLVNAIVAIVTGAVNPVIFASLSRFQSDRNKFDEAFYRMQKYLGIAVVPVASMLFVFSDMIVGLYLGEKWKEASTFFGLYALASAFVVVFGHIASNAYRSLGKPVYSLLAQVGFLFFLVPSLVIGAKSGFAVLSIVVPFFRLVGILAVHSVICVFLMHFSIKGMLFNMRYVYLTAIIISVPTYFLINVFHLNYLWQMLLLILNFVLYIVLYFTFKDTRKTVLEMSNRFGLSKLVKALAPKSK